MERICRQKTGLFPTPDEIELSCSCPDWASMCKHVAAVLYGIGARLDEQPELLFRLRAVDEKELIAKAGKGIPLSKKGPADDKVLAPDGLSELFGLDLGTGEEDATPGPASPQKKAAGKRRRTKAAPRRKETPTPAKPARRGASTMARQESPKSRPKAPPRAKPGSAGKKRRER
jgi:uncharacterized Zn finger protein